MVKSEPKSFNPLVGKSELRQHRVRLCSGTLVSIPLRGKMNCGFSPENIKLLGTPDVSIPLRGKVNCGRNSLETKPFTFTDTYISIPLRGKVNCGVDLS